MKSQTVWEYLKSVRSVEASMKLKLKDAFSCEWTQIQQHFVVREWSIWNLKTSRMIEGKTVHISRQLFTCHPISFEGLVLLKFIQSVFECRLIRNVRNRLHFCNKSQPVNNINNLWFHHFDWKSNIFVRNWTIIVDFALISKKKQLVKSSFRKNWSKNTKNNGSTCFLF